MAEATLTDVTKGLREVNETLRQQAIEAGKPDPVKFIKEEFVAIALQKRQAEASVKSQAKIAKEINEQEQVDQKYYKKQLFEQEKTTLVGKESSSFLKHIATLSVKGNQIFESASKSLKNVPLMLTDNRIVLSGLAQQQSFASKAMEDFKSFGGEIKEGFKEFGSELTDGFRGVMIDSRKAPKDAAAKEAENDAAARHARHMALLGKVSGGINGLRKSFGGFLKDKGKKSIDSLFGLIKNVLLGAGAIGALFFLNSGKMQDVIKFIRDDVAPIIGPLIDNIGFFAKDIIMALKDFFTGPDMDKAIKNFKEGEVLKGLGNILLGIIKPGGLIDNFAKASENFFRRMFGAEEVEEGILSRAAKKTRTLGMAVENTLIDVTNFLIDTMNTFLPKSLEARRVLKHGEIYDPKIHQSDLVGHFSTGASIESSAIEKQLKEEGFETHRFGNVEGNIRRQQIRQEREAAKEEQEQLSKSQKETSKLIDVIKKTAGQRGALGASPVDAFTSQIVKRQKELLKQRKELESGDVRTGADFLGRGVGGGRLRTDVIKQLTQELDQLRAARQNIISNSGNVATTSVDQSNSVSVPQTPLDNSSPVIGKLNAAGYGTGGI